MWRKLKENTLPQSALNFLDSYERFDGIKSKIEFHEPWFEAYYNGKTPDEAKDWIIVVWDGWYYKVDAIFMTWFRNTQGNIAGKCNWSKNALFRTIQAIKKGEEPPWDPNYQT